MTLHLRSARSACLSTAAVVAAGLLGLATIVGPALAAAPPRSGSYMQPVDTSAGSISDPRHMLQIDMEKWISVNVSGQPAEVAYNQITALASVEWGFAPGTSKTTPVTLSVSGPARDVIKALGSAAGVRFEANGPLQLRVVKARAASPAPKRRQQLPPQNHP